MINSIAMMLFREVIIPKRDYFLQNVTLIIASHYLPTLFYKHVQSCRVCCRKDTVIKNKNLHKLFFKSFSSTVFNMKMLLVRNCGGLERYITQVIFKYLCLHKNDLKEVFFFTFFYSFYFERLYMILEFLFH